MNILKTPEIYFAYNSGDLLCGKPGTIMTPLIERLLPLLAREGLKVVHLIKEDSSVVFKNVFFEPTLEISPRRSPVPTLF